MAKDEEKKEPPKCLNHPDRVAVLDSDLGGAIQPIQLCEECVSRSNLERFV